jgi:hypothetical protein
MISFFRFVMVMTSSFSLFLFDNLTERGAMQLAFRTPTLTPTRTPTGVIRAPQPYPNRLFVPALLNDFVRKGVFFISVDASGSHAVHLPGHDVPDKVLILGGHFLRARALKQALSDET